MIAMRPDWFCVGYLQQHPEAPSRPATFPTTPRAPGSCQSPGGHWDLRAEGWTACNPQGEKTDVQCTQTGNRDEYAILSSLQTISAKCYSRSSGKRLQNYGKSPCESWDNSSDTLGFPGDVPSNTSWWSAGPRGNPGTICRCRTEAENMAKESQVAWKNKNQMSGQGLHVYLYLYLPIYLPTYLSIHRFIHLLFSPCFSLYIHFRDHPTEVPRRVLFLWWCKMFVYSLAHLAVFWRLNIVEMSNIFFGRREKPNWE